MKMDKDGMIAKATYHLWRRTIENATWAEKVIQSGIKAMTSLLELEEHLVTREEASCC